MFVALDARDERIQIETHEQAVRLRTAGTPYRCPACREELIIRNGRVLPAHFAHRSGSDCVVGEPESRDHLLGKHLLAEWARAAGWQVDFEVYFSGIKQRADLVLRRPGTVHALEFQCAPLSGQRLAERTAGYAQVGVTVQWLLGPRYFADHPTAVQGKFEMWGPERGRELRFVDPRRRRMWAWWGITGTGMQVEELAPYPRPAVWRPRGVSLAQEASRVVQALAYRDKAAVAVQSMCYERGVNLGGCPVVVHRCLTAVAGLTDKEWLVRVRWLLRFWRERVWSVTASKQWWCDYVEPARVPLLGQRRVAEVAATAWLDVLIEEGYLVREGNTLRWIRWPRWYADVDRKLGAINRGEY